MTDEHFVWVMSKVISIDSAVTQTSSAVVSLLKYLGKSFDPLPQTVDLPGVMLVLSNKKDAYYVVTDVGCSCPSAAYRPSQRCKHQRKHFPQADKPAPIAPVDSPQPVGKWPGGFNGPVDPEHIKARASGEKGV
jgi:hypothetical protein